MNNIIIFRNGETGKYLANMFLDEIEEYTKQCDEKGEWFKAGFFHKMHSDYSEKISNAFDDLDVNLYVDIFLEWLDEMKMSFYYFKSKPDFWWNEMLKIQTGRENK